MKIIIAEDQSILRSSLAENLRAYNMNVTEVINGQELVDNYKGHDIIVTNIDMPVKNGEDAIEEIRLKDKEIPIYVVTMHDDKMLHKKLISLGVNAAFIKSKESIETILQIITFKETTIRPAVARILVDDIQECKRLTPREEEILNLKKQGLTSQQVADRLYISLHTANTHWQNINKKVKFIRTYQGV